MYVYRDLFVLWFHFITVFNYSQIHIKKRKLIKISRLHGKQSMLSDGGVMMTRFFINGLINLVSLAVCLQVQILGAQGIAQQLLRVLQLLQLDLEIGQLLVDVKLQHVSGVFL